MTSNSKTPNYALEAPEGGWGYLVCLGMGLVFVSAGIGMHCYGLIFNDFLKSIGVGTSVVAIANSCSFGAMSIAGLFSNTLIQRFDKRSVGIVGAAVFGLGGSIQIFAQSAMHLFMAAAVQGVAFGLIIPIIFSTFNNYFVKKRALMMSVTQSIIGIGHMVVPIIIEHLLDKYGFRGCVAIITAFNLHCIFGMQIMHPVEWHTKKVYANDENIANENELHSQNEITFNTNQLKPLMDDIKGKNYKKSLDSVYRLKSEESPIESRRQSLASLSNWTGSIIITEAIEPEPKTIGKWKLIINFLDLGLLKQPVYVNIVLGITLSFYADLSFFSFQPLYLFELQYTQSEVAKIIAIGAGADLFSRCVLAVVSAVKTIPARHIYLMGALCSIFARYVFLYVHDFWAMAVLTGVAQFFKTWMHIPMPLIFAEYLPKERFSSGYGLFMFLQGMIMFAIGPVVGLIRDETKSYSTAFQFLNLCLAVNVVAWFLEIVWVQCRKTSRKTSINEDAEIVKQATTNQ